MHLSSYNDIVQLLFIFFTHANVKFLMFLGQVKQSVERKEPSQESP